ncbi:MAG: YncE family protein [Thermodesulfobacteriota bacterium]
MKKKLITAFATMALTFAGMQAAEALDLQGTAYVQGHGGHIAVVDLATGAVGRYQHGKPSDAVTVSKDGKILYTFSLDGHAKEINADSGEQSEWTKLGQKHCGSNYAPDGTIWVSDMKDGKVYVYDPATKKLVDSFEVSKSICGINFSRDGKFCYVSDMPGGFVSIVDVATKKVVGKMENVGNFIHRAEVTPDGKELWQSDGSELQAGSAVGVGYAKAGASPGGVSIVDLATGKVKDFVITGGNPHDVDFTPDGKYAIVGVRQVPEQDDSALVVINTESKRIVKIYSACKSCHGVQGVEIAEDKDAGRPFLCAVDIDWARTAMPKGVELETGAQAIPKTSPGCAELQ